MALGWLPVVGAIIGAISGLAAWGVSFIAPHELVVATAFALPIVLTGAIHIDGFLDCCDALFALATTERRLEILRDPRHGTFAVAGFAVLAAFWIAALVNIAPVALPLALALGGALSRVFAVLGAFLIPYGRPGERTRPFEHAPPIALVGLALVLCAALATGLVVQGVRGVAVAVVAAPALAALVSARLRRAFGGGLTGDAYGFVIAIAEVSVLVSLAIPLAP